MQVLRSCLLLPQRLVEEIQGKESEKNAVVKLSQTVQSALNVRLGFAVWLCHLVLPSRDPI